MADKPLDAPNELSESCDAPRVPLGSSRFWLLAATLMLLWFAAWPVTDTAGKLTLAAIELTYLFGCWKTRRAVHWVTPSLYVPYAWLLVTWAWGRESGRNWDWIRAAIHLPGRYVVACFEPLSAWGSVALATTSAVAIFLLLVTAGRSSRRAANVAAAIALILSTANSYWCYLDFVSN